LETRIPLLSLEEEQRLFGPHDRHVKLVARKLGVRFSSRGGQLRMRGEETVVSPLVARVEELLVRLRAGEDLSSGQIEDKLLGREVDITEEPRNQAVVEARRLAVSGSGRRVGEGGLPSARTQTQQV
jgi:phosphate starvation-inducible protein PhoH